MCYSEKSQAAEARIVGKSANTFPLPLLVEQTDDPAQISHQWSSQRCCVGLIEMLKQTNYLKNGRLSLAI